MMKRQSYRQLVTWMSHPIRMVVILLCLLLVLGAGSWFFIQLNQPSPSLPKTYVDTLIIKALPGVEEWQAVGTVGAEQDILIASEVVGTIQGLMVKSNQQVEKDEILLTINHADLLADLAKDKAIVVEKTENYNRMSKLSNTKVASAAMLSEALSALRQAEANVQEDQALLEKYIIKAPFSGTVGIWQVNVGQLVKQGDGLVTLSKMSPAYINFTLPAKALNSIHIDNIIQFTSSAYPGKAWEGKIIAIEPRLDQATRGLQIRAEVENKNNMLVPSLYGQVTIKKELPPQISIPQEAINYEPTGEFVFIVTNNSQVKKQMVTLGSHQGDRVVVLSGIKENDEVVIAGTLRLYPDAPVQVKKQFTQKPVI